ncbi:MAG: sulfite exporter TauE/SafE family protein [Cyclobacteriaceae bacterium]|nr:sulfite exporter TauE/SafE family protein [Cyclobacteriaceae bacterium]
MVELIDILGYVAAFIIGVVLGLIGGGGSILTVPVFVYLLGIQPVIATGYSLFVVGTTALVGGLLYVKKQLVDFKTAIIFATPAFIAVYLTRKFIITAIPDVLVSNDMFIITKEIALMIFFGAIMLAASFSMIRNKKQKEEEAAQKNQIVKYNIPAITIEGAVVGVITGLVGAGGGFMIIPALVLFAKLPMKKAVGTSLIIIAVKSLIGFIGDVENIEIEWGFLLLFSGIAIVGILLGTYINKLIPGAKLQKGFGWFVLLMAIYILINETVL